MKLFFHYLRERVALILTAALCCLIFAVSFLLYHLPLAAVAYPAVLCLAICPAVLAIGFSRYVRKHRLLCTIRDIADTAIADLPAPESLIDQDYGEIIRTLTDKFKQTAREADERYTDLTDYYTVWVHQVKTPIAAMRLTLQNEDSALSRRLGADLLRIEQYVDMVLAYLRLDSSSTDYLIRTYDLDTIIRASVKKFAGEFITRKLRLDYTPCDRTVITDEKWLSFVIEQLLSNALKYTAAGSIRIYRDKDALCICDTGSGIAPGDLPRVFEKGFTGYNGRADKRASGLGLWLCKTVCDRLGHSLTITSAPGEGTCVRVGIDRAHITHE